MTLEEKRTRQNNESVFLTGSILIQRTNVRVSSDGACPSFTGVVLSDEDELAFPKTVLWLLSCELAGSVKASWVELESESITTSLS